MKAGLTIILLVIGLIVMLRYTAEYDVHITKVGDQDVVISKKVWTGEVHTNAVRFYGPKWFCIYVKK